MSGVGSAAGRPEGAGSAESVPVNHVNDGDETAGGKASSGPGSTMPWRWIEIRMVVRNGRASTG